MKEINVNGRIFQYEVIANNNGEYGYYYETMFYEGVETYTIRKYLLFGPKLTKTRPKYVFTIDCNIESESYTKSEIRSRVLKKVELLERKKQIERGEII